MEHEDDHIKQVAQEVCMPRGICEQKDKTIKAELCSVKKVADNAKNISIGVANDMKKLYVVLILALLAFIGNIGYSMVRTDTMSHTELAKIVASEVTRGLNQNKTGH